MSAPTTHLINPQTYRTLCGNKLVQLPAKSDLAVIANIKTTESDATCRNCIRIESSKRKAKNE